jgi:hypothetical protein
MTGASQRPFAGKSLIKRREIASNPGSNPGSRTQYSIHVQFPHSIKSFKQEREYNYGKPSKMGRNLDHNWQFAT